jgi:hypothetical protein
MWVTTATAPVVAITRPMASNPIGRRLAWNSLSDVK